MLLPTNLGIKIYLTIFSIASGLNMISLCSSQGATHIYYNTLIIFYKPAAWWYVLAILNAILSCTAVIPLFRRAFKMPCYWTTFFQWLFLLRIALLFLGHNYEFLVFKSALTGTPLLGFITISVWILFLFPSFKEHYIYAFKK